MQLVIACTRKDTQSHIHRMEKKNHRPSATMMMMIAFDISLRRQRSAPVTHVFSHHMSVGSGARLILTDCPLE